MITVRDMATNDEIWTPLEAVWPLLPHLPKEAIIWEMCPGAGKLVKYLRHEGWIVINKKIDSLVQLPYQPFNIIVTNPPWSKKHLFIQRCVELQKPFGLLLPVRTLGVARCQNWLTTCDFLFLRKRVDFTGGGAPYEACMWVTKGLLNGRVVFEKEIGT